MTRQTPRELPWKPSDRDQNLALGTIRGPAYKTGAIAAGIYATLMIERLLMVAIADTGEIFAVDPESTLGMKFLRRNPEWLVGTYTRRCGVGAIQRDMREHVRLGRAVA